MDDNNTESIMNSLPLFHPSIFYLIGREHGDESSAHEQGEIFFNPRTIWGVMMLISVMRWHLRYEADHAMPSGFFFAIILYPHKL